MDGDRLLLALSGRLPVVAYRSRMIGMAQAEGVEPSLRGLEALVLPLHQACSVDIQLSSCKKGRETSTGPLVLCSGSSPRTTEGLPGQARPGIAIGDAGLSLLRLLHGCGTRRIGRVDRKGAQGRGEGPRLICKSLHAFHGGHRTHLRDGVKQLSATSAKIFHLALSTGSGNLLPEPRTGIDRLVLTTYCPHMMNGQVSTWEK